MSHKGKTGVVTLLSLALGGLAPGAAPAATITPNIPGDNFANDMNCSLREAISVANTNSNATEPDCAITGTLGDDTIVLAGLNHPLTLVGAGNDTNVTGDLDINTGAAAGDLTIRGAGSASTTITGSGDRVLDNPVGDAANALTIDDLKVTGGSTPAGEDGGGLQKGSAGALVITDSVFSSNTAAVNGGGIFAEVVNSFTITGSTIGPTNAAVAGGGIGVNSGPLTLTDSDVQQNSAALGGGISTQFGNMVANGATTEIKQNSATQEGGGIYQLSSDVTLNAGVSVSNNTVTRATGAAVGGGIRVHSNSGSDLTLNGATVSGNAATSTDATNAGTAHGGGIAFNSQAQLTLNGATVNMNSTTGTGGGGGGIYATATPATLTAASSTISDNTSTIANDADDGFPLGGGGLLLDSPVPSLSAVAALTDTTVSGNDVVVNDAGNTAAGAGIRNVSSSLTLNRSTISGNDLSLGSPMARNGAGIYGSGSASTRLLNSTVSGNIAGGTSAGGGIHHGTATTGSLTLVHSTFALNTTGGVGAAGNAVVAGGTTTMRGSIIDQPVAGCQGTITANAYNVDRSTTCVGAAADTDFPNTNPNLQGLALNAPGTTMTHAVPVGSPVIDAVPAAACQDLLSAPLTVDQRGVARPDDGNGNGVYDCEPGSYELAVSGPFVPPVTPSPPVVTPPTGENPACAALRAKLKKAKSKKKKKKIRKQLRKLGC